ncbi:uncharacterized protein LOC135606516 [Musa acuminata AAA Group]|uniref:uncharacterized protein LOC135606516 n=1 Tax=Musa acuminata AAA Group TaxID=214697 RepID=UPI0031D29D82
MITNGNLNPDDDDAVLPFVRSLFIALVRSASTTPRTKQGRMTTEPLGKPALEASPSFGGASASASASVDENEPASDASKSASRHDFSAHQVSPSEAEEKNAVDEDDDDSGDEFEFTFAVRDADAFPSVTADEIFSGGRIIPTYPVFNRDLLLPLSAADEPTITAKDQADQISFGRLQIVTGAESSTEELAAAGEHFPGEADRCKKSASTGSSMQWRLRDMVGRSHSDGKEKFVFLEASAKKNIMSPNTARAAAGGKGAKEGGRLAEVDAVTGHRRFHGKGTSEKAVKGPRRSFLPYRQQLLGLFAPVNGLRRSHHPF